MPRFPQPPSKPDVRFSLIRLSTEPSTHPFRSRALACFPDGRLCSWSDHSPEGHYSSGLVRRAWFGCQAFPQNELCCLAPRTVLCPAPTPSRLAGRWPWSRTGDGAVASARAEEGLSSSVLDYPYIPSPLTPEGSWRLRFPGLHRFHGLRRLDRGSAPSCPPRDRSRSGCLTMRQTSRNATDYRVACLSFQRLYPRASTAGFRRTPPFSYSAAGPLPRPDFHRQVEHSLAGHTSSPALHPRAGGGGGSKISR